MYIDRAYFGLFGGLGLYSTSESPARLSWAMPYRSGSKATALDRMSYCQYFWKTGKTRTLYQDIPAVHNLIPASNPVFYGHALRGCFHKWGRIHILSVFIRTLPFVIYARAPDFWNLSCGPGILNIDGGSKPEFMALVHLDFATDQSHVWTTALSSVNTGA